MTLTPTRLPPSGNTGLGLTPGATIVSLPPVPRVGGIDGSTPWTGGSELDPRTSPLDILCYRPLDFTAKQKQMIALKEGLEESRRLDLPNDTGKTISLVSWIQEVKLLVETRGFDTVFRLVSGLSETYLLDKWGEVTQSQVEQMIESYTDRYDLENLRLSGLALRDSLGADLYSRVPSLTGENASGPLIFKVAIDQVMFMNANMIRHLSNTLGSLKLKDIDGENVGKLGEQITQLAREIEGSGRPPSDLLNLVSRPYTTGSVDMFKTYALSVHSQVMTGTYSRTWDKLVTEHNSFYRDLVQSGDYPPANGSNQDQDGVIHALIAQAIDKKLEQIVPSGGKGRNGGDNTNSTTRNVRKCFACGSEDHLIRNCPNRGEKNWRHIPPDTSKGDPTEKTVDGILYRWCGKCRGNKGLWTEGDKAHFTSDHRSRGDGSTPPGVGVSDTPSVPTPAPTAGDQANLGFVTTPLEFGFYCLPVSSPDTFNLLPKGGRGNSSS